MIPAGQAETAALLRRLAGADPIETHISAVFLGADTVWKLRKAVRLAFVDFSTLAERERTARRELALNAPAAPGLYRDVVPVTRAPDGSLALDGTGEPVDWVVRMARVPEGDFLDVMATRGRLTDKLLDALADSVAALHAANPPAPSPADTLPQVAQGNARAARDAGIAPTTIESWHAAIAAALALTAPARHARAAAGFVRRCHGDLHLGNLCLWRGTPAAFDALEFDEALATTDTGYDLAFLLMDLDQRAGRPAANLVLNRYLARTGDWGLVPLLPAWLSMRAMIRAHAQAARAAPDAAHYLARALEYLAPPPPLVLAIGGLPGSGKSTLARALAPGLGAAPGAVILRSDEIRKRQAGIAPETRLPPAAYSAAASAAVFAEIAAAAASLAQGGHAVIADATYMDPAHRVALESAVAGTRFHGIWLDVPLPELERRVAARTDDPSDADLAVLRRAAAAGAHAGTWHAIDAREAATALAAIREILADRPRTPHI